MAIEHAPRDSARHRATLGFPGVKPTVGGLLVHGVRRFDPVRDSQATFRVALAALASPGQIQQLPVPCIGAPVSEWVGAVLLTLLDHETTLHVRLPDEQSGIHPLAHYVAMRTGARHANAPTADVVVGTGVDGDLLRQLQRGTLEYPDTGASLVVPVGSLAEDGAGAGGVHLQIGGPGVPIGLTFGATDISAAWVSDRAEVVAGYPVGVDIFLVDDHGRIVGLPRSSSLKVLTRGTDGVQPSEGH